MLEYFDKVMGTGVVKEDISASPTRLWAVTWVEM